ncbi:MAG: hypothetical protein K0S37_4791 [Microbacterium sp.]|jgi:hypothetical protein|nr:hypothetical protein [Microbacterium sp.]
MTRKTKRLQSDLAEWKLAFRELAGVLRGNPAASYPATKPILDQTRGSAIGDLTVAQRFVQEVQIPATITEKERREAVDAAVNAVRVELTDAYNASLKAHEGVHADALEAAREQARHETLQTVLQALELEHYKRKNPMLTIGALQAALARMPYEAPRQYDTAAFWSDIETTLRVRAEDAEAERDEAAAARIEAITFRAVPTIGFVDEVRDFDTAGETIIDSQDRS